MSARSLVVTVAVAISVSSILVTIFTGDASSLPTAIGRNILTLLLAYSLVQGWKPGRWITVVLMGLGGLGMLAVGLLFFAKSTPLALLSLLVGVVYIGSVIALLTPTAAEHFESWD